MEQSTELFVCGKIQLCQNLQKALSVQRIRLCSFIMVSERSKIKKKLVYVQEMQRYDSRKQSHVDYMVVGGSIMGEDLFGRCPYFTAQKVLQGKWCILIMHYLSDGPVRFNQLLRRMPEMTHATLSKQLKQMEQNGLVIRKEYLQVPPKVEYSLSEIGLQFMPVLGSLQQWGEKYIAYLQTKQTDQEGQL